MSYDSSGRVLVASNRGPLSFTLAPDGTLSARRGGGGGLVSGMLPGLMRVAAADEVLWICAALSDADREAARRYHRGERFGIGACGTPASGEVAGSEAIPGGRIGVRTLDIPEPVFQGAYNSVANATLWFVHHMLFDTPVRPSFGPAFRRDWGSYVAYNETFARALVEGAAGAEGTAGAGNAEGAGAPEGLEPAGSPEPARPRVLVQDYHLTLVPRMLRELVPGIRIAHFSHTPWAPVEYYRMLPDDVSRGILDGILGADHAGFLSQRWANAFLDCCAALLGAQVDKAAGTVIHRGHVTGVAVHPLGIDAAALRARAFAADVDEQVAALAAAAKGRKLLVRVDRTELSKNILRGLAAYRELLATRPQWRGQVAHIVFAYPSRTGVPGYREYTEEVQRLAREITEEFGTVDWDPLIFEVRDDYPRSLAACRLADVLVVNPIRDGMNLVAEEGPVLSEHGCALILSREAGAADLLGPDALLINPYDVSRTADAMHQALSMDEAERQRRCAALAASVTGRHPGQWLADQLDALP